MGGEGTSRNLGLPPTFAPALHLGPLPLKTVKHAETSRRPPGERLFSIGVWYLLYTEEGCKVLIYHISARQSIRGGRAWRPT